jgi:hypothetical protein
MLAGGEGPGGILFREFPAAYLIGSVTYQQGDPRDTSGMH